MVSLLEMIIPIVIIIFGLALIIFTFSRQKPSSDLNISKYHDIKCNFSSTDDSQKYAQNFTDFKNMLSDESSIKFTNLTKTNVASKLEEFEEKAVKN